MLKRLVIVAALLVPLYGDSQTHKTAQTEGSQQPSAPTAPSAGMQHGNSPTPKTEPKQHVDADVKIITLPGKDWEDVAALAVSIVLALVGIAGVAVGVFTLCYLRKQASEMQLQRRVMARTLMTVRRQVEIEKKTLVLQFRPHVVVRRTKATGLGIEPGEPGKCKLEFDVVNSGGSPAHIIIGTVQLLSYIASGTEDIQFLEGCKVRIGEFTLQPGERLPFEQDSMTTGTINDTDWMLYYCGDGSGRKVILIGDIWYKDDIGITRQAGLYRPFDPKTGNFVPKPDEEQEYSD